MPTSAIITIPNSLSFTLTKDEAIDDLQALEKSLQLIAEEKDESVEIMRTLTAANKY
jgi:hypothetical protein